MIPNNLPKCRRGGQPGNQNSRGNRGNQNPRRNFGNRGGGAPLGNRNASKRLATPDSILLQDYKHIPEAAEWIVAHAAKLKEAAFTHDEHRDPAIYAGFCGKTPEALAKSGQEYRQGVFTLMEMNIDESEERAA